MKSNIIFGFHRSGTSAFSKNIYLSNLIKNQKLNSIKFIDKNIHNPNGYYESVIINEKLNLLCEKYERPVFGNFIKPFDQTALNFDDILKEINSSIIVKNPRLMLFPEIVSNFHIDQLKLIIRNPLDAVISLMKRDGFSWEYALYQYLRYNFYFKDVFKFFVNNVTVYEEYFENSSITYNIPVNYKEHKYAKKAVQIYLELKNKNFSSLSDIFTDVDCEFLGEKFYSRKDSELITTIINSNRIEQNNYKNFNVALSYNSEFVKWSINKNKVIEKFSQSPSVLNESDPIIDSSVETALQEHKKELEKSVILPFQINSLSLFKVKLFIIFLLFCIKNKRKNKKLAYSLLNKILINHDILVGYKNLNSDLEGMSDAKLFHHMISHGIREMRFLKYQNISFNLDYFARSSFDDLIPAVDETNDQIRSTAQTVFRHINIDALKTKEINPKSLSIVTILMKLDESLSFQCFLNGIKKQNDSHFSSIELIIVLDDKIDKSKINNFKKFVKKSANLKNVKIVINEKNLGNCLSRNIGAKNATGNFICFIDADCIFSLNSFEKIYKYFGRSNFDFGWIGYNHEINISQCKNIEDVEILLEEDFTNLNWATKLQEPRKPDIPLNTVTRGLIVKKEFFKQCQFNSSYTYSKDTNTGYGWEDVEWGIRASSITNKFGFIDDVGSIHVAHASKGGNLPYRSAKNFYKLIKSDKSIIHNNNEWFQSTASAIRDWCKIEDNKDGINLINSLPILNNNNENNRYKNLNVLTHYWHQPHQFDLWQIGWKVDAVVSDEWPDFTRFWNTKYREKIHNLNELSITEFKKIETLSKYDLVIVHFDENIFRPFYGGASLGENWGKPALDLIKIAKNFDLPIIGICHGTPQFEEQYKDLETITVDEVHLDYFRSFFNFPIVTNSIQAADEWKFEKSQTIWHGIDYTRFRSLNNSTELNMYTSDKSGIDSRPIYRGKRLLNNCQKYFKINYFQRASSYFEYINSFQSFNSYFNSTARSPMPRQRAEAMLSGRLIITTRNHDAEIFIKDGENGFLVDDPEEFREVVKFLNKYPDQILSISENGRETAKNLFNLTRYHDDWVNFLKEIL